MLLNIYKIILSLVATAVFIIYDMANLQPTQEIREFNIFAEFAFALMALILFLSIDSLKGKSFYHFLSVGFFMTYVSMLVDGLDQLYIHGEVYTAIWEKGALLLGFSMLFLGVRGWIVDHGKLNKKLEIQTYTDELTGLYNRRGMLKKFETMNEKAEERNKTLSFIIADLDDFKLFNDTMGHLHGDKLLAEIGDLLLKMMGPDQVIGRWGGEEFAICMLGNDLNEAFEFAEKIRQAVSEISMPLEMGDKTMTVSLGVSQKKVQEPLMNALRRADRSLYAAKKKGKNQSVVD